MKRIALLILAALPAWAAGSCTVTAPQQFSSSASWVLTVACTGDSSTGSFPKVNLTALQPLLGGYVSRVETVPGTTAPTANYSMTLLDAKGGDELNGQGSGTMSATAVQIFAIGTGTPITASETLNLTGNSVASAGVTVYIYVIAANNTMAQILALGGGTSAGGGGGGGGVTSVFSRTGAVTAQTGDYSVSQVTGAAGINGSPTANAVVTDYSASLVQTPNASSTLDGSGNLGVGGSITSGIGCVTTACISSDTWYDSGATHATVQLGATNGYNGTNTWDGNAPVTGYLWGAYGVSGNNASVGWVAPAATTVNGATCTPGSSCNANYSTGSFTSGHLATFSGTSNQIQDGGAIPVSPTTNQNLRTIGAVLTPTALTACVYVAFAGTINAFHAVAGDGATADTVLVKVETQPTFTTFISTGVSGASDISNGGEQLTSVLGKVDTTLTSWTTALAAGTTVCFVASTFSAGTSVNANVNIAAQ